MLKKIVSIVLVAGILFAFGCCKKVDVNTGVETQSLSNCISKVGDWFCTNRVTIENDIATAQATINTINATFGAVIPPQYEAVIVAAQVVIAEGQSILAGISCPTAADVATVQGAVNKLNVVRAVVNTDRMAVGVKLIP